jgi:hypothetical protein
VKLWLQKKSAKILKYLARRNCSSALKPNISLIQINDQLSMIPGIF